MRFDHLNIRAVDQEAMKDFLVSVLGLTVGSRPDFGFHGYWLYLDDQAIIHLQGRDGPAEGGSGCVDHIAFGPFDFDAKRRQLEQVGRPFTSAEVPGLPLRQIFVPGPDGIRLELQCPTRRSGDG